MEQGQITLDRQRTVRWIGNGIRFFLAAALTASQSVGDYAPFALGLVSAAGPGLAGGFALLGAGAGALVFLSFADALPHVAIGVLILTAATAFQNNAFLTRPRVPAWTAALLSLVVWGVYVLQSLSPLEKLTPCLAAAGLTGVSAWLFRPVLQPEPERPAADGFLFLGAALALALAELEVSGISPGRMLLSVLLICAAYGRGAVTGAYAGLGLGLTADLCLGTGSGIFTAAMGLAGLLSGSRQGSRGTAAGAFALGMLLVLLPGREPLARPFLLESLLAAGGISGAAGALVWRKTGSKERSAGISGGKGIEGAVDESGRGLAGIV